MSSGTKGSCTEAVGCGVLLLLQVRVVEHAFDIIHLLTDQNPIQIVVDAIINSGPREDATRIGSAGVVRRQAVDISPLRRVNQVCSAGRQQMATAVTAAADSSSNSSDPNCSSYGFPGRRQL
eukprot:GHUV01055667.1.p2 GENE.GHUV01055667.1~~GHUV01055667.1.p2  ORF type:complete len:122 (-),score=48.51 GHUV01055667.1:21-386(-)